MQATVMAVAAREMFISSKIGARSFGNGRQDIGEDTEGILGAVAGY